jgi:L-amino acid N-acyltransferase
MRIEDAAESDLPGIVAIYNDVLANSTAVFSEESVTVGERGSWLRARREQGHPVIVAHEAGAVVGFASYGDFRPWPGYRSTVEHSVHVAAGSRRRGIGRRLVEELLDRARQADKHVMIAGVDAENLASLRLHEELGFERVAHLSQVARKFDRWLDLVLLQRTL